MERTAVHDIALAPTWDSLRTGSVAWAPPPLPTTVVVPHPDDEALLFGGLIALQRARGVPVTVIAVTDGERAYDDVDAQELARTRRGEQERSLEILGVSSTSIRRLGVPDGEVGNELERVATAVAESGTPIVAAPWEHDHHVDHEACGRAARIGAAGRGMEVWSGLFWAWHHTDPRLVAVDDLVHVDLDESIRGVRRAALEAHRTQLPASRSDAVLSPPLLAPMSWHREYFIAPESDTAQRVGR